MRRAGRPDHELTVTGELRLAPKDLIPEPSTDDAGCLLQIVHMHRRTGAWTSDAVGPKAFAAWSLRHTRKREELTASVVDCVRVYRVFHSCVFDDRLILLNVDLDTADESRHDVV